MRTRKKKRSRKRIGTSLILLLAALLFPASWAAGSKAAASYALVAGTVFQQSGYALPGAAVTLAPDPQPGVRLPKGLKKAHTTANSRGEFVFRVPAGPMHYTLKAEANGFQGQEKSVEIQGEERADVTFQLRPQSK